jgi:hypothetical protein
MLKGHWPLILVILVGGGAIAGLLALQPQDSSPGVTPSVTSSPSLDGWQGYKDTELNQQILSFQYPSGWTVKNIEPQDTAFSSLEVVDSTPREGTDLPANITMNAYKSISDLDSKKLAVTDLKNYLDQYSALADPVYTNVKSLDIAGLESYKASAGPNQFGGGTYYFITNGDKQANNPIYKIWTFKDDAWTTLILSTAKFIQGQ